jgi:uncharacterized protein (TIGR02996 family)
LEQDIVQNPGDPSRHVTYADWLRKQGDPLGDFIRLQMELEEQGQPPDLRADRAKREQELLAAHERAWLGDLAEPLLVQKEYFLQRGLNPEYLPYQFRRGWLNRLAVDGSWFGAEADERGRKLTFDARQNARAIAFAEFMRVLARSRAARLVETLFLYTFIFDWGNKPSDSYPSLCRVKTLTLGDDSDPRGVGRDDGQLAVPLIASMPLLTSLSLWLPELDPAPLCALPTLKTLRSLSICLDGSAPEIWPRALARSHDLLDLFELSFCHAQPGDRLCEALAQSGMLRRLRGLETLSLRACQLTDQGAQILAKCPDLRGLGQLRIRDNDALGERVVEELRSAGPRVIVNGGVSDGGA